jgi:hypothetical protein
MSTANHPQTDGQSEHTNQQMEQGLRILTSKQPRDWAKWLPIIQYTKNAWVNSTTKKTPFELILGYTPIIQQPRRATHLPNLDKQIKEIQGHRQEAQEAIKTMQKRLVKETNFKPFKVEDLVWLERTNLPLPYKSTKLVPKRYRPFPIHTEDIGHNIPAQTTLTLENPQHLPRQTPHTLQTDRQIWVKLPRTSAGTPRGQTRMGSRGDHGTTANLEQTTIPDPVEGLLTSA